jgi:formylglycine-generating enzyme required for sulfatase activity/alpha-tubulin suppressor-like RCC1 family protein
VGKLDCDDHNDCTTDDCQKGLGCKNTARQGFCNDGDSCTADDYCLDGVCTGGTNSCGCSTDDECEPLNDADWCNGYLYCNKGKTPAVCELNLKSIKTCNTAGDSTCQAEVCDPGDGVCKFKARNEGQVCAATCTVNPTCQAGQCKGQSCVAAGMACASGTCIANACAAGLKVCDGDFAYLTCNGSGNGWTGPTSCGDGKYCDGGDCKAQVCTPSAAACVGKLAGTCNSSGSGLVAGYTNCEAIPATPFCQGGACTACSPNCTGKVCGDDGCGGRCGECTTFCINEKGRCCVPDCKERNCGVDGCGGNCGTCEGARVCSASGRCIFDIETLGNKWLSIPGGTFKMGCSDGDENCMSDERPTRMVTTTAFEMLETEVTEAQYLSVVGDNPSCKTCGSSGPSMPVDSVDWEQAKSFCTMVGGRLPSEAEWEYAARGGTSTRFYCGNDLACRSSVAWTGGPGKHAVKGKLPNNFGLYDMLGNVWEWTADWHGTFSSAAQTDPTGPVKGTVHAKRGGGFADGQVCGYLCPHVMSRVSARQGPPPPSDYSWGYYFGGPSALGFRCARQNCSSGLPACGKKECGDDGCGHSCGICNDSSQCNLGRCVPNWAGVDSGQYHVCASGEDGSVWCWGSNSSSEAGFQNTDYYIHIPRRLDYPTGVMMLAAGDQHTCALKADGAVWCWGRNGSGQLGNGETNSSPDPQAVRVLGLPSVRTIFSGAYHVCSVDYEGSVWCWGRNSEGQLGDGFKTDRSTPAKVSGLPKIVSMALGMYHSCALAESGAIWCWGFNTQGQLGTGGTTDLAGPQEVNGISNATDLAAGILSSCAVLADGAVACWGYNGTGELGLGAKDNLPHPVPVKVSNLPSITRVWSSFYHVCALDVANNIWCWGLNYSGGLGDGSIIDRALPVKVQSIGAVEELSLSMGSTCTRKNDGSIWCWGSGDYGELGDGKGTSSLIPVKVQ